MIDLLKYPKRIAWWHGTDALKLLMYPPGDKFWYIRIFFHRIYWQIMWRFFDHWVVDEKLSHHLIKFGITSKIKIHANIPEFQSIKSISHSNFNILFYRPVRKKNQKFKDWVYGYDIILEAKKVIKGVNWIGVDGKADMQRIYSITDFYLRPNRHDGMPLMILECQFYGIPYYWSDNFNPKIEEIIDAVEKIRSAKKIKEG
jgi:hypothetical protein